MRSRGIRALLLVATSLLACTAAYAAPSETTVFGTNTYPDDVQAVQQAVDNFDVVTLSGTFNFGETEWGGTPVGIVYVTRANLILKGPATIIGGGAPSDPWFIWPVIDVTAPGVSVRDLTLVDFVDTGIYVHGWVGPSTTPTGVTIRNNSISGEWAGIVVYAYRLSGNDPIEILNNNVTAGYFAISLNYTGGLPIEIRGNTLAGGENAIDSYWTGHYFDWMEWRIFEGMSPLDITDNEILNGILISGWSVAASALPPTLPPATDPAEWGDNGPVTISGNVQTCEPVLSGEVRIAMMLGTSAWGLNHGLVSDNTIWGECTGGIYKWPYGGDHAIIGNDLSGLTTNGYAQIGVNGRDTTVAYNILGPTLNWAALEIVSANWHSFPDPVDSPMPLPVENCTFLDNDYRNTGLPGWSDGQGAILVASEVDLQLYSGVGNEVRNNFIFESGMFPQGSGGAKKHVFEMIVEPDPLVHDDRIVGLPANRTSDPGIGQRIKGLRTEMIWDRMTALEFEK